MISASILVGRGAVAFRRWRVGVFSTGLRDAAEAKDSAEEAQTASEGESETDRGKSGTPPITMIVPPAVWSRLAVVVSPPPPPGENCGPTSGQVRPGGGAVRFQDQRARTPAQPSCMV